MIGDKKDSKLGLMEAENEEKFPLLRILLQKTEKEREVKRSKIFLGFAKGVGKLVTNLRSASNH